MGKELDDFRRDAEAFGQYLDGVRGMIRECPPAGLEALCASVRAAAAGRWWELSGEDTGAVATMAVIGLTVALQGLAEAEAKEVPVG